MLAMEENPGDTEVALQRQLVSQSQSEAEVASSESNATATQSNSSAGAANDTSPMAASNSSTQQPQPAVTTDTAASSPRGSEANVTATAAVHPDCSKCHGLCKTDTCRAWCKTKWCRKQDASQSADRNATMQSVGTNQTKVNPLGGKGTQVPQKVMNPGNGSSQAGHIIKVYEHKTIRIVHPPPGPPPSPPITKSSQKVSPPTVPAKVPKLEVEVEGLPKLDYDSPEDHTMIKIMHDAEVKANAFVKQADDHPGDEALLKKAQDALSAVETMRQKDLQYFHDHLPQRAAAEHRTLRWRSKPEDVPKNEQKTLELEERVKQLEQMRQRLGNHTRAQNTNEQSNRSGPHNNVLTTQEADRAKQRDKDLIKKVERLSKKAKELNNKGAPLNYQEANAAIKQSHSKELQYKSRVTDSIESRSSNELKEKRLHNGIQKIDQQWIDSQLRPKPYPNPNVNTKVNEEDKHEDAVETITNSHAHADAMSQIHRDEEHEDARRAIQKLMRTAASVTQHANTAQEHAHQAKASMRGAANALGLHIHVKEPDEDHPDASYSTQLTPAAKAANQTVTSKSDSNATKEHDPVNKKKQILVSAKARAEEAVQKAEIRKEANKLIQGHEASMKKAEKVASDKVKSAKKKEKEKAALAKAAGSAAGKKAAKELDDIKKKGVKSEEVQKEAEKVAASDNSTAGIKSVNATEVAVNKIKAKAKAAGKAAERKAQKQVEAAEKEHALVSRQMDRSKELSHKSNKTVEEKNVLKREAVTKLHQVQQKMGLRDDPTAITDAVDSANATNKQQADTETSTQATRPSNQSSTDDSAADMAGEKVVDSATVEPKEPQ